MNSNLENVSGLRQFNQTQQRAWVLTARVAQIDSDATSSQEAGRRSNLEIENKSASHVGPLTTCRSGGVGTSDNGFGSQPQSPPSQHPQQSLVVPSLGIQQHAPSSVFAELIGEQQQQQDGIATYAQITSVEIADTIARI